MKTILLQYALKSLIATFALAIVAVGILAVHLTHINASVTVTFGDQQKAYAESDSIQLAQAIDMTALAPLPVRKPKQGR